MTCKDCVHYEVCKEHCSESSSDLPDLIDLWLRPENCKHFKNKADVVEIPCRCKDCEYFNNYDHDGTYCEEHSDGWGDNRVYVDEDDYCSFGIRKR